MVPRVFGHFLLDQGVITLEQLVEVVGVRHGRMLALIDEAARRGMLAPGQVVPLRTAMLVEHRRFRDAAVQLAGLTEAQVDEVAAAVGYEHAYIGEAVVACGFASLEAIDAKLGVWNRRARQASSELVLPGAMSNSTGILEAFSLTALLVEMVWGVQGTAGRVEQRPTGVELTGERVVVRYGGAASFDYVLAVPPTLADVVKQPGTLAEASRDLASTVAARVVGRLGGEGVTVTVSEPSSHEATAAACVVLSIAFGAGEIVIAAYPR